MGETKTTVKRLTELADELLDFARRNPEAYDELCEAAAQIVEAKRKIAKTASTCGENRKYLRSRREVLLVKR